VSDLSIEWLRGLAEKGGKGVVNNIDARSLGRIADELDRLRKAIREADKRLADMGYSDLTKARKILRHTGVVGSPKP
jgi:hypothetical protein